MRYWKIIEGGGKSEKPKLCYSTASRVGRCEMILEYIHIFAGLLQSTILESVGCIWFNRSEAKDREIVARKYVLLKRLMLPFLIRLAIVVSVLYFQAKGTC